MADAPQLADEPAADASGTLTWDSLLRPRRDQLHRLNWKPAHVITGILFLIVWRIGLRGLATADLSPRVLFLLGTVLPTVVITVIPIRAFIKAGGQWRDLRFNFGRMSLELLLAPPVVIGLIMASAIMGVLWQQYTGTETELAEGVEELIFSRSLLVFAVFAVMACVWAPLIEELFFRGFLQNALARWMPVWLAAILQTVLFAAVHPYSGIDFVLILFVGAVLTAYYLWRGNLLATMWVHAGFNGLMTLLFLGMLLTARSAPVLGISHALDAEQCTVTHVFEGTAAAEAGLRPGDTIVELDDKPIDSPSDLRLHLLTKRPGDPVRITFVRDGDRHLAEATLTKAPADQRN